ncbi:restriction endonuclease subunit S [Citrobacter portucalensis]|uniref:restriction endonuclease subunit S n=1 Tax=Citrobacter portucalensis TaxID=1639133 RepID=UPI00202D0D4E|nr:restriction endonuclease subunit S [Citrobacter portucalensis]URR14893.1 restriction endonuclease subunit S [Citrobacter portucalensis]
MVPKGWSVFRLEDIVIRTQLGTTERGMSEDPLTTLIPLIKMGNLGWGSVNFNKVEYIEQSLINDSFLLKKGDFLFNTRNTPDLVGKSAVWDEDYTATFDNNINRIVFNKKVYTNFIAYYLNTGKGKSAIQSLPAGSTSVAAIYWKDLKNIQLLLPSLGEQQKIVQILSTWDKSIVVTGKLLTNSHRQKKALMQQLLTGNKRLLDENGVRFNGKWEKKLLSDVADVYQPKTISQSMMSDSGYPVYGANGVIGFYQEFNHETEQIAVTCRGSTCGIVNWTQAKSWITGNAMVINTDNYSYVSKKFLFYTLNGSDLKYLISGSGQPQITGNIKTHIINLPCIEEQQKIATVLSAADAEIYTLEKKLACLRDEKKALMQQLLTGKRRVKVDEAVAE